MKAEWETKNIGDLCDVIAGQSPEGKFYNTDGHGMPFYQGKKDFGEKFIKNRTSWTTQTTKIAREGDIELWSSLVFERIMLKRQPC